MRQVHKTKTTKQRLDNDRRLQGRRPFLVHIQSLDPYYLSFNVIDPFSDRVDNLDFGAIGRPVFVEMHAGNHRSSPIVVSYQTFILGLQAVSIHYTRKLCFVVQSVFILCADVRCQAL